MSQPKLLKHVVAALDAAGIDYMVTGSVASSLQGDPRATHDLDFVVQIAAEQLPELIRVFPPNRVPHFPATIEVPAKVTPEHPPACDLADAAFRNWVRFVGPFIRGPGSDESQRGSRAQ